MRVVTIARKPLASDGVVKNCLEYDTAALNIDRCRIRYRSEADKTLTVGDGAFQPEPGVGASFPHHKENWGEWHVNHDGRWPANIMLRHTEDCREIGTRWVRSGTAHREHGGNTIFSETKKPALPNMTYASADGTEAIPEWECSASCPVRRVDQQSGSSKELGGASRFFRQFNR